MSRSSSVAFGCLTFLARLRLTVVIVHSADEVNSIYKEANSIKKLRHKNIVELYHAFVEGKQLIMIMELASGGELMEYVQKMGKLNEIEARKILIQIVNAI